MYPARVTPSNESLPPNADFHAAGKHSTLQQHPRRASGPHRPLLPGAGPPQQPTPVIRRPGQTCDFLSGFPTLLHPFRHREEFCNIRRLPGSCRVILQLLQSFQKELSGSQQ